MAGIHSNHGCPALLINGVEDHVHILCQLGRTISIADLIREVKTASSEWVKSQPSGPRDFSWQSGYGVFSVSQSLVEKVRDYIATQEEHHRKKTFQDELRALFRRHGIEFDERYVWD